MSGTKTRASPVLGSGAETRAPPVLGSGTETRAPPVHVLGSGTETNAPTVLGSGTETRAPPLLASGTVTHHSKLSCTEKEKNVGHAYRSWKVLSRKMAVVCICFKPFENSTSVQMSHWI